MLQAKSYFATCLLYLCFGITNSCSQSALPESPALYGVFEASTPCDDLSKKLLKIPLDAKCEFMKWKLSLFQDSSATMPSTFNLTCVYGLAKQASRDFLEGAKTIELKGKCAIRTGTVENPKVIVYTLSADNSPITLSFFQPGPNLLHLLSDENRLMKGNAAWSYTLNRINPITVFADKIIPQVTSELKLDSDSATVGIFEGRTPCNSALTEMNDISTEGCQIIKCQLTLFQDVKTHSPTTFQLLTIYVGKGDNKYTNTGKWVVTKGTRYDPEAIVYKLDTNSEKPHKIVSLLKADNNILFFLNKDGEIMVGNNYSSYTLNRAEK
jgi:NlpE N-terminal domain